jgi:mannose-6-phosphate isomerase-like protein (cupin superfamily)
VEFETKRLPVARDSVAQDGSDVRVLLGLDHGGLAHFELGPGKTSCAVTHRTVEEIWFVLRGRGEMWRKQGEREEVVPMEQGICITIPLGTQFQFRSFGYEPLAAVGVTMPPGQEKERQWKSKGYGHLLSDSFHPALSRAEGRGWFLASVLSR